MRTQYKTNIWFPFLLLIIMTAACDWFDVEKRIVGNFYLYGDNSLDESLCYKTPEFGYYSIIGPGISAVGYNNDYIIARCRKPEEVRKDYLVYYIIPIKKRFSHYTQIKYIGPLNESEFYRKRKELGISRNLVFTIFPG